MDPITHGLAGAVIARAGFSKSLERWGPITGIIVALSPDSDIILRLFGEEIFLRYHRGITHSFFFLPVFSLFWAVVFQRLFKLKRFNHLYLLSFLSILSHILLDLMTSFGTMALSPFTDRRMAWDIVFIVDPYFTAILLIPFVLTFSFKQYKKRLGVLSLAVLAPYTLLCIYNHNYSVSLANRMAYEKGVDPVMVAALPQPLSPFKWVLLIDSGENLYQSFIEIESYKEGGHSTKNMVWKKWPDSPWIEKALRLPGVGFYMWFARFPVGMVKDLADGGHLVEFIDLRFDIMRGKLPFTYRVEFNQEGTIIKERFTAVNSFLDENGRRQFDINR